MSWELLLARSAAEMKSHCRVGRGPLLGSVNKARLVECGSTCLHPQHLGVGAGRSVETFKGSFVTCGAGYGAGLHETPFQNEREGGGGKIVLQTWMADGISSQFPPQAV